MDALNGFSLLLVDDHPLFRDGLAVALRHQAPGLEVTAVASLADTLQALENDAEKFDLVLLDYRLPVIDGLRGAVQIRQQYPGVSVGLMSGLEDPTLPRRARDAGLMAYFPKTLEVPELLAHLCRVAQGDTAFEDRDALSCHAPVPACDQSGVVGPYGLTLRQAEVLRLLGTGGTNKEIARELGISPATVKNHLDAMFSKMGATNRVQAVMMARSADDPHGR